MFQSSRFKHKVFGDEFGINSDKYPDASRNILLMFSTDGFNPYKGSMYSIWPMLLAILNLPASIRYKPKYILMAGLIPGPSKPKSIQPYLEILVNELLQYEENTFTVYDASQDKNINIQLKLMFTVADYPAHSLINNQQGVASYSACMKCNLKVHTISIRPVYVSHTLIFRY